MKTLRLIFILFTIIIFTSSCNKDDDISNSKQTTFGSFTVMEDEETVLMNGEIESRTLRDVNNMLENYPKIKLINMKVVLGSNDDEINFQVGVKLRIHGVNTHILDDGSIASGGVDLFLSGVKRTRGTNVMLGVHSWSDSEGNEATDFPVDSEEHRANIKYFEDLGYIDEWAKDFYFFTINAASADDIHYMTEEEIQQFNIFN